MIKINLVPQEILDKEQLRQRNTQLVIVAFIAGFFIIGYSFIRYTTMRAAEAKLTMVNNEYNSKWAGIGAQLDAKKAAVAALKTRLGVITDLLSGRYLYPHFMADMSLAMPPDVSVTGITTTRDSSGLKVTAQATSTSAPGVTRWVRTLQKPGVFGNFGEPTISAITAALDSNTNSKLYTFSMAFAYTPKS